MDIIEKLKWRYATKKFDSTAYLSEEKLTIIKDAFNLTAVFHYLSYKDVKLIDANGKQILKPFHELPTLYPYNDKFTGFNKSINHLPKSLTHLTFNDEFNKNVDDLPKSLTHLTFGIRFNQTVNNLPQSLKYPAESPSR